MAGLTGTQRNAFEGLLALFRSFGLGSLAPDLLKIVRQGYTDAGTVELLLQDTPAWKQRFAGNELRRKAGLNVLDPATYLDLENQYDQVLKQYGIPKGQYGRSDFAQWIGNNTSPTEIQSRVQMAASAQYQSDDAFKNALAAFGIDRGHQISYFLDENKALPFLQRQFQAATIGASALRHGLHLDTNFADQLAGIGITGAQAESGYSQIANELGNIQRLAGINDGSFTQSQYEKALFLNDPNAIKSLAGYQQTEAARFGGSAGAGSRADATALQGAY